MSARIRHRRYLTMAETFGKEGGAILLSASGKITNAVDWQHLHDLIPPKFDVRGAVVYLGFSPSSEDVELLQGQDIKEIYFSAEVSNVWQNSADTHTHHLEGISYAEDIAKLEDEMGLREPTVRGG